MEQGQQATVVQLNNQKEGDLPNVENSFHQIFESIPVPVAVTTPTGEVEALNRPTLEYFGKTFEELKAWKTSDVVHPDDLQRTITAQRAAHEAGTAYEVESRHLRADGIYRWFHVRGLPLRDEQGHILRWFHLLVDIDDRRQAEEALRAREDNLNQIINAIPALAWSARPDGSAEFFNQHYLDYLGLSAEQAGDWGWTVVVHPDDRSTLAETWQSILASGQPGEAEARLRRHDGEYRWLLFRANPLHDESGNIVKWYGTNTDIDDRKRAEDELRRSDARKTAILDAALDCVITMDHEGRIIEFNPAAERTFAYRREEVIGEQLAEIIIPPSLREQHKQGLIRYLATGEERVLGKRIEMTAVRADGSEFPVELAITRIRSDGPPLFTGYLRDITQRKGSLERLQAKQDLLDLAQKSAGAMAFDWYIQEEINSWSPEQEALFGLAPGTFDGTYKTWKSMMYAPDWPTVVEAIQHAHQTGQVSAEYRVVWPDGSLHWLSTNGRMFFDDEGQPLRMVGFTSDVTRRKQAEEELRRSEAFLAEGQHLARMGNFSWRIGTNEITWSDQLYRIFGFDPGIPMTLELIATRVHPDDIALLHDMVDRAQRGVSDLEYEHRLLMPDNSVKYLHLIAHRSRDEQGDMEYIGAVQDVTQRRISEGALSEARSELARVARITSLGVLTASIAHEVNQPLSGIITNANTCVRMLDADPPNIDGARETARRTIRDGNRASEVIARLRALFSKKDFTAESVDLNEAAQEVVALSRSELQKSQVVLEMELDKDLPPVDGDRVQLQQVILNLLRNASDAMSSVDGRPRRLLIRTEGDVDRAILSVNDSGIGFDPESMNKLFEAFYTTKNEGMGIGLSVSKSIIENHQGLLWATPNDGPGATFSFSIPCSSDGFGTASGFSDHSKGSS